MIGKETIIEAWARFRPVQSKAEGAEKIKKAQNLS